MTLYTDSADGGGSRGRIQADSVIRFIYRLGDPKPFPYAALVFPLESVEGLDLKEFSFLEVRARSSRSLGIITQFIARPDADLRENPGAANWLFQANLSLGRSWQTSRLDLASFSTPPWWREQYGIKDTASRRPAGQAVHLEFAGGNFLHLPKHVEDTLELAEAALLIDRRPRLLWALLLAVLLWIPWEALRRRDNGKSLPHYEKLPVLDPAEADWKKLQAHLAAHYRDEVINVKVLSKATGIPAHRINPLIEKFSGAPLIAYVNTIRIAEGARLLKESTLPVKQIAFEVGYSTVAHFNRRFKESFGISPSAYRQGGEGSRGEKSPV